VGALRLLLSLTVLIDHAGPGFSLHRFTLPGSIAVQSFYIISGFYMALVLHRKYNFPGATRLFYQQRYLRLAPIYWVTLLTTSTTMWKYPRARLSTAGHCWGRFRRGSGS
jgi:peptidoglycan/LPS O-acetylase OafA/YrhL